jgi:excisionase family DNA binding protein
MSVSWNHGPAEPAAIGRVKIMGVEETTVSLRSVEAMNVSDLPTLDALATSPKLAKDLSANVAAALLTKLAGVQTALLGRLLMGNGNGADPGATTEPLLKIPDVAKRLDVPTAFAYELVRRGEIPTVRVGKKYVRVSSAALKKWMAESGLDTGVPSAYTARRRLKR